MPKKTLRNISEIRRYFHTNKEPIYFVSATNFNLLGLDEWVRNFKFICYMDCYDGRHPNVLCPSELPHDEFQSLEDINNYLLQHKEVVDYVKARGGKPKFVFLMFNDETEKLVREIGGEVWFPKAKMRSKMDDKIQTVRIGNEAGVPSVPNTLAEVKSYDALREVCKKNDLGDDLVIQAAYGDSGKTTYFVSGEDDWRQYESKIVDEGEVKIMKRIDCRGSAIEACVTSKGTIVGPLMTELVGFQELTPYRGGWCGNEIFSTAFTPKAREQAREMTFKFGEQLREEGYRGYFNLDFLIDKKTGELWLGELNPRITGASSMTNHAAFAHADAPLFLFHLLEFSKKPFELDVDELNARWADADMIDSWSQKIIKHTDDNVDIITHAPPTGIYRIDEQGNIAYDRFDYHRRAVEGENEAFFLRISAPGDYRYEGADLGILVTRGRSMTKNFQLTDRSKQWIEGIKNAFAAKPLPSAEATQAPAFKIM